MAENEVPEEEVDVEKSPVEKIGLNNKRKLILYGSISAIVIIAVGVGLVYFLSGNNEASLAAKSADPQEAGTESASPSGEFQDPPAEGSGDGTTNAETGATQSPAPQDGKFGCTTNFKPFQLNLGNPLENRYIRLSIAIEHACSESQKREIKKRLPQLRDAVIAITSRKTREFLLGPDGKAQLRKEITNRINQFMNKKVNDVYITDILIE